MPLVSLDRVSIAYGHLPLLEDGTLRLDPGERVCVIGRNGTGKSTLLEILAGVLPPDRGVVRREPGARTAMLVQDVPLSSDRPVLDEPINDLDLETLELLEARRGSFRG